MICGRQWPTWLLSLAFVLIAAGIVILVQWLANGGLGGP